MQVPSFRIAAIGELLWDMLPQGAQLGGAPANFASLCANIGSSQERCHEVFLISCVGHDVLGASALEQLQRHHVQSNFISIDPEHPTGQVTVVLNAKGAATYTIHENAAWDWIPFSPALGNMASTLDAIYFGTLAQRSLMTQESLRRLVAATPANCIRVFDVNLRPPFWTADAVRWGCEHATLLKLNEEEVPQIAQALQLGAEQADVVAIAQKLLQQFALEYVAITRGAQGCALVTRERVVENEGISIEVADTVGAGDAFTAALTCALLNGMELQDACALANRWGAWVATQTGGMPMPHESLRVRLN